VYTQEYLKTKIYFDAFLSKVEFYTLLIKSLIYSVEPSGVIGLTSQ